MSDETKEGFGLGDDFDVDDLDNKDDVIGDVDEVEVEYTDDEEEGTQTSEAYSHFTTIAEDDALVNMPNPHGGIVENANGGEGTIVRTAYLGKEMQTSFLEYSRRPRWPEARSSSYPLRYERVWLYAQPPSYEIGAHCW